LRILHAQSDNGNGTGVPVGLLKATVSHPLLHELEVADGVGVFDGLSELK
jgi:hypothetical protein